MCLRLALLVIFAIPLCSSWAFAQANGNLQIHYINVQQGGCTLIVGPDGTTMLLEAGKNGKGTSRVVPYLTILGILPASGLDYVVAGHQHIDHVGGLDEVINAGYDVRRAVLDNGSTENSTATFITSFRTAAQGTTAGPVRAMTLGEEFSLGNGAKAKCVAVNGKLIDGVEVTVSDENDRSIALLVTFGNFQYLFASDLGGGDEICTAHDTTQTNVEQGLAHALRAGANPLVPPSGVEVLHVNHHGSKSSTRSDYMNLLRPKVACISVGDGAVLGSTKFQHPRKDVVENVLYAQSSCVTVPPALVLQTEEGKPTGSQTSFKGFCVGDIIIESDGQTLFTVRATGNVSQGPDERQAAGLPRNFALN